MNFRNLFKKSIPTFDVIKNVPSGADLPKLPNISTNGIKGTWDYMGQIENRLTYEFIPNKWQWANRTILTITLETSPPTYKSEFPLEFAFKCGGVDYFEFVDKNNLPYERGLEALTFYQEMQNGVTNDYIKNYNAAMSKLLSDPKKINLNEIIKLQMRFEERCNFIISKDIIYKVASVAFVDKSEPLTRYDFKANEKKIKNWKENAGDSFFLSMPIKKLVPFLAKSGDTSLTYLAIVEKVEQIQQDILSLQTLGMELQAEKD